MFLGTEFEKTRIIDERITKLDPKVEEVVEEKEENFIDEDLLSNDFTENSYTAEGYKTKFM